MGTEGKLSAGQVERMKGTVYTGIIYLPKHPQADMHGLLRCAVRTERGMSHLAHICLVNVSPCNGSPDRFNASNIGGMIERSRPV